MNNKYVQQCKTQNTITLTAILVPTLLSIVIGIVLITTGKLSVENKSQFWFVVMEIVGSFMLTGGVATIAALIPTVVINMPCPNPISDETGL